MDDVQVDGEMSDEPAVEAPKHDQPTDTKSSACDVDANDQSVEAHAAAVAGSSKKRVQQPPYTYWTYYSLDSVNIYIESDIRPTTEYLNMITPSDMPPHNLRLCVDAIVILLRNINPVAGLCNGSRMIVMELNKYTVKCQLLNANKMIVYISRIKLTC